MKKLIPTPRGTMMLVRKSSSNHYFAQEIELMQPIKGSLKPISAHDLSAKLGVNVNNFFK